MLVYIIRAYSLFIPKKKKATLRTMGPVKFMGKERALQKEHLAFQTTYFRANTMGQ